jgi:transcriptional regulator
MAQGEIIIELWHKGRTGDEIADITGYSRDCVFAHLRRARQMGDPRAARRTEQAPARRRAVQVALLARIGLDTHEIAKWVGVTRRCVQMNLRKMQ